MNCSNCNTQIQPDAAFCDNCGTPVSAVSPPPAAAVYTPPAPPPAPMADGSACPQCGYAVTPGEAYCGDCGAAISAAAPAILPTSQPPADPAATVYSPPMPAANVGAVCSQCQTPVTAGSAFCDNCGAAVSAAASPPYQPPAVAQQPAQQQPPPYQPPPAQPVAPRLVVQATNTPLTIPTGKSEIGIGREDAVSGHFPDVDLDPHGGAEGGVSRSHAKLIIQGNQFFLEDLQAVNYTFVNRQKLTPKTRQPLNDGDELRFGKVVVMFYTQ